MFSSQQSILPLSFPVSVYGKKQTATVVKDVSDVEAFRYQVYFSDGTEDLFTVVEGPIDEVKNSQHCSSEYTLALERDLPILAKLEPENWFYVMPLKVQEEPTNVWLVEDDPLPNEKENISVYYNQKAWFELFLPNDATPWQARKLGRSLEPIEEALVHELLPLMEGIRNAMASLFTKG